MIWPGLAVDGTIEGDGDAPADAAVDGAADVGAVDGAAPPHAPTTSATTEATAPSRVNIVLPMTLLPVFFLVIASRDGRNVERGYEGPLEWLSSVPSAALHSIP